MFEAVGAVRSGPRSLDIQAPPIGVRAMGMALNLRKVTIIVSLMELLM